MPQCIYDRVRETLASGIAQICALPVKAGNIQCPGRGCSAVSAAPLTFHLDAPEMAGCLNENRTLFGELFGVLFVERVRAENGHLLFDFTKAFYTEAIRQTLRDYAPVSELKLPENRWEYALWRMNMLSRKGVHACPDDKAVQNALWLAMGIPERIGEPRLMKLRLSEAAEALLTMTHHLRPAERTKLLNECGGVAEAAQRLLDYGICDLARYSKIDSN